MAWKSWGFGALFFFGIFTAEPGQAYSKVAVLIPGTFNSVLPGGLTAPWNKGPYFGSPIQKAFDSAGYDIFIPQKLAWFGLFETNGWRAYEELKDWYWKKYPEGKVPVTLVGHSAGGLYALRVAHLAAKDDAKIPIENIVFLSTPLNGSRMADVLWANPFSSDIWVKAKNVGLRSPIGFDLPWIDVLGVYELTSHMVRFFLWRTRIPAHIKLFALGGSQTCPTAGDDPANSQFLAPAYCGLSLLFFGEDTDGAVQIGSAYGTKANILDTEGKEMPLRVLTNLRSRLDHTEVHIDPDYLDTLKFQNVDFVRSEQARVFSGLVQTLQEP